MQPVIARRGLSLLEAVIALFILSGALLVVLGIFQSAVHYTAEASQRQTAALVAEKTFESLREQARSTTGTTYGFDTWATSPPLAALTPDPDFPDYFVQAQIASAALYSPCSNVEQSLHALDPRVLTSSTYKVKVTVSWGSSASVSVISYIGDPLRGVPTNSTTALFPTLNVTASGTLPTTLAVNATQSYTVQAVDAGGNPVHDLLVDWYVALGNASATLSQDRRGLNVNATNAVYPTSGPPVHTGGQLQLMARARLWGYEQAGLSEPLSLAVPP